MSRELVFCKVILHGIDNLNHTNWYHHSDALTIFCNRLLSKLTNDFCIFTVGTKICIKLQFCHQALLGSWSTLQYYLHFLKIQKNNPSSNTHKKSQLWKRKGLKNALCDISMYMYVWKCITFFYTSMLQYLDLFSYFSSHKFCDSLVNRSKVAEASISAILSATELRILYSWHSIAQKTLGLAKR